jgi:hypothetical protein
MDNQERKHLEELRQAHQKRLQVLEQQAAHFGLSAPPHVLIEIEDIKQTIASIDAQLAVAKPPLPHASESETIAILLLSADPTNASRLRLGEELREIQEKLRLAKLRERFVLEQRMSIRPVDVSQALLDVHPQVVHFSGHGMRNGALCFENSRCLGFG